MKNEDDYEEKRKGMIGIIVTGHGSFATGMTSGLKLLAGELVDYEAVDFESEDSVEQLEEKLKMALVRLDNCSEVLIVSDITGGSPFNVSIKMKLSGREGLEVIGGTNLPVVLDAYMRREMVDCVSTLAYTACNAGKEQLIVYEANISDEDDEFEE